MPGLGYLEKTIVQKNYKNAPDHKRGRKRVCLLCGAEFELFAPNQKYCSLVCREAARKAARRAFDEANPNYRKEYMREYRKRLKMREK